MSMRFYVEKLAREMIGSAKSFDELDVGEGIQILRTKEGYSYFFIEERTLRGEGDE